MRDEYQKVSKKKEERIEELAKTVRVLQKTQEEKDQAMGNLKEKKELMQARLDLLEKNLDEQTKMAKDGHERADSTTKAYQEIAHLFGAENNLCSTFLATKFVREKLEDHRKTEHELSKEKNNLAEEKSKYEKEKLEKEQAVKERDTLSKTCNELKQKLTEVRHELLTVTRELRCLMVNNEHILQEQERCNDTMKSKDSTLKDLREKIEKLEKAKAAMASVESEAIGKWEKERERLENEAAGMRAALENKNDCETTHLSQTITSMEHDMQKQHEWVDMCKELGKLLDVDIDLKKGPESANKLYREVETMVELKASLKKDIKSAKSHIHELKCAAIVASQGGHHHGGSHHIVTQPSHVSHSQGEDSSHLHYLKAELRRSTEAMASAQERFCKFKESVAKALKFGKRASKVDATSILARINNLVMRVATPLDSKFDSVLHVGGRCCARSKTTTRLTGDHSKTARVLEKVQKKFRAALETIEAQDMWISVLQAKLEGSDCEQNEWNVKHCRARDSMMACKGELLDDLVDCEEERLNSSVKMGKYYTHLGKVPKTY